MTPEKIRALCVYYNNYFKSLGISSAHPIAGPCINSDAKAWEYCHERCLHIIELLDEEREEEAYHWLRFVQGVLWSTNMFSFMDIEEMNEENNPPRP